MSISLTTHLNCESRSSTSVLKLKATTADFELEFSRKSQTKCLSKTNKQLK